MPIIDEIKRQMRLNEFNTQEKAKLIGGYLLNNILTYMEAIEDGQDTPIAVLYSSHDGTLLALLSVLNMLNGELVPYASAILFEISRSDDQDLSIQILYRNSTDHPPFNLDIPNCSSPCSLSKFLKNYKSQRINSIDQLDQLCKKKTDFEDSSKSYHHHHHHHSSSSSSEKNQKS